MEMFQFEHINYIYLIGIVFLVALLFLFNRRQQEVKLAKLGNVQRLRTALKLPAPILTRTRQALLLISLLLLVVALTNPQLGSKKETVKREAIDLIIALDISNSMLAEDLSPNRLERAKKLAIELVQAMRGNRIGLILFAGNAYVQMPLTTDYGAFNTFINAAKPSLASTQGTEFGTMLTLAEQTFIEETQAAKVVLTITDGEYHDENALEEAQRLNDLGMKIYAVGIGTEAGGYIPMFFNGNRDFKRDQAGNLVLTKINLAFLSELAQTGGGQLFPYTGERNLAQQIADQLNQLEKSEMEQRIYTDYYSYFQYFLGLGILLLVIELLLRNRPSKS